MKTIIFVLIAECWMTVGQVFFKKSAVDLEQDKDPSKPWLALMAKNLLGSPMLWMGIVTMLAGLFFWFAALRSGALNYVYLLGSIQYIFTLIAAHFFLQEKINAFKLIGTLLITLGIILTVVS